MQNNIIAFLEPENRKQKCNKIPLVNMMGLLKKFVLKQTKLSASYSRPPIHLRDLISLLHNYHKLTGEGTSKIRTSNRHKCLKTTCLFRRYVLIQARYKKPTNNIHSRASRINQLPTFNISISSLNLCQHNVDNYEKMLP